MFTHLLVPQGLGSTGAHSQCEQQEELLSHIHTLLKYTCMGGELTLLLPREAIQTIVYIYYTK